MDLGPAVVELLQHGIRDGAADTAAHHADLLLALGLGGLAQGAHKVLEAVALFHAAQLFRGGAHGLDDDGDGALLRVIVVDRYGDSLAVLIHAQDDELARLGLLGDQGCLDLIQGDGGTEGLFSHDTIHSVPSFPNDRILVFAAMYPSARHIVYTLTQPPKAVNPFLRGFCEKNNKLSSAPSGRSIILYKG